MRPLDWTHAVRDIPADGLNVERTATPEEAARLAEALEIVAMTSLTARYRLLMRPGGRVALTGTVDARLDQECVVTLEPVPAALRIPLDVVFTATAGGDEAAGEANLDDLDSPDEEPIENGTVDVGRVVVEELLSNLDPYPRAPGASFDWSDDRNAPARDNPFAVLSRMKKPGESA